MITETTTKIILTEEEEEALLEVCDIIRDIKSNLSNKALFPYPDADVNMLINHCEKMTKDLDLILDDADKIISFESDRKEV